MNFLKTKKNVPETVDKNDGVDLLVQKLLAEPFSKEFDLEETSLENLGRVLEELDEQQRTQSLPPTFTPLLQSYQRCKELYCLLLMRLEELQWKRIPDETIGALQNRDQNTQFLAPKISSSRQPAPVRLDSAPAEKAPPSQDAVEASPPESDVLAIDEEEATAANDIPFLQSADIQPVPAEGTSLTAETTDAPSPLPPPERLDPLASPAAPTVELPSHIDPEWATDLCLTGEFPVPGDTPSAPAPDQPLPNRLTLSASAQEYLKASEFFRAVAETEGERVPLAVANRFLAQSISFAVECECQERLQGSLQAFWSEKEEAIRRILTYANEQPEIDPLLAQSFVKLAEECAPWLPGGKFPFRAVLNSLQYLQTAQDISTFSPSPLEAAVLLLFFGRDAKPNGFVLKNYLNARGLAEKEFLELAFRLVRCQKVRNQCLSHLPRTFNLKDLERDSQRILELLGRLEAGQKEETETTAQT